MFSKVDGLKLRQMLEEDGFTIEFVEKTGKGHHKLTLSHPDVDRTFVIFTSGTPSDHRILKNVLMKARKALRKIKDDEFKMLKAQFLPGRSPKQWVNIIGTQKSFNQFIKTLTSGDFAATGMKQTLAFVQGDNFNSLIGTIFQEGADEEDSKDRFEALKTLLPTHLAPKRQRNRIMSVDEVNPLFESIEKKIRAEAYKDLPTDFQAVEVFLRSHPGILVKNKTKWRKAYGPVIAPFLKNRPEIFGKLGLRPRSVVERRKGERGQKRMESGGKGYAPKQQNDYELRELFSLKSETKDKALQRKYTISDIDWEDAKKYYQEIAILHRALIPNGILIAGLYEKTGTKYKINPYLNLILDHNTLDEAYANLNLGITERVHHDNIERLFDVKDRVYPLAFKEFMLSLEFEGEHIVIGEDRDKSEAKFAGDSISILQRLKPLHFQEEAQGSDNVLDLIERVWAQLIMDGEFADEAEIGHDNKKEIMTLRESMGTLNSTMENYELDSPTMNFGRNPKELLDVLVTGADALGLSITKYSRETFVELYDDFKAKLAGSVEEKLKEIVDDQFTFSELNVGAKNNKKSIYVLLIAEGFLL